MSEQKTVITRISDGFDFLGWNVCKKHGKEVAITPSRNNLNQVIDKVNSILNCDSYKSSTEQLTALKEKIGGWVRYHRNVVTKSSFDHAMNEIKACLGEIANHDELKALFSSPLSDKDIAAIQK